MEEILNALVMHLKPLALEGDPPPVKTVVQLSEVEILRLVREDQYPILAIMPTGEAQSSGEVGNAWRVEYQFKLRLLYQTPRFQQVRRGPQGIFFSSEVLRQRLMTDKRLGGAVHGMNPDFQIRDFSTVSEGSQDNLFVGRDFEISYYRFIDAQGPANPGSGEPISIGSMTIN